jgi:hypothetical protein
MSKQRKTPDQAPAGPRVEAGRAREPEAAGPGNAAVQDVMAGRVVETRAPLDVVRDVAAPMVDRAVLALQIYPRGPEVDRFVQILERSGLADDRKSALVDRLRTDEAGAAGVAEVVTRHFGGDGEDVRGAIVDALDAVGRGLREGGPGESGATWRIGEVEHGLGVAALDGAVASRAEALVAELAARLAPAPIGAASDPGEALRALCRDLHLRLLWDEEEEEEPTVGEPEVAGA